MKAVIAALLVILSVFLVVAIMQVESGRPTSVLARAITGSPEFGWKPVSTVSFSMQPASTRTWTFRAPAKLQVHVKAEQPVTICGAQQVFEATSNCEVTPNAPLVIADGRQTSDAAVSAIAGLVTKSNKMMESAIAPNRVTLDISQWDCIKNCAP